MRSNDTYTIVELVKTFNLKINPRHSNQSLINKLQDSWRPLARQTKTKLPFKAPALPGKILRLSQLASPTTWAHKAPKMQPNPTLIRTIKARTRVKRRTTSLVSQTMKSQWTLTMLSPIFFQTGSLMAALSPKSAGKGWPTSKQQCWSKSSRRTPTGRAERSPRWARDSVYQGARSTSGTGTGSGKPSSRMVLRQSWMTTRACRWTEPWPKDNCFAKCKELVCNIPPPS